MPPSQTKQIGSSVGIELETEEITAEAWAGKPHFVPCGISFKQTHDASIETNIETLNGLPVILKNKISRLGLQKGRKGTEIVSSIINTESPDYIQVLKWLTNELACLGESQRSYRAGFHVHVNTPYDLKILKSIIRLGRYMEQVFYLLGGMGYDYRGKKNDSTYCRPITKYGPVCVPISHGRYAQVFNIGDLLKSDSTNAFLNRYGNLDAFMGSRYVPVRYHWLNLVPMFGQGSLEFRVFNKSLNPFYLYAIIELCKAFSYYAIGSSFVTMKSADLLVENSVFDIRGEKDREKIIETFNYFVSISALAEKPEVVDILREILTISDIDSIVLPDEYIYTHLMFHPTQRVPRHWESSEYSPSGIRPSLIKKPHYEDIHTLAGETRNPEVELNPDEDNSDEEPEEEQTEDIPDISPTATDTSTFVFNDSPFIIRRTPRA